MQTNAFYIAHYITPLVFGASRGTRAARFHTALEHTSHLEAHNSSKIVGANSAMGKSKAIEFVRKEYAAFEACFGADAVSSNFTMEAFSTKMAANDGDVVVVMDEGYRTPPH